MSKISTVYDALVTKIDSVLSTGYTRIPDPENMEDGSKRFMDKGWGCYYGGGTITEAPFCQVGIDHTFTVVCSRKLVTTDSDTAQRDSISKELMEDAYKVQNAVFNYDQLDIPNDIVKIDDISASEIQNAFTGKVKYKFITINFLVTIWEDLI